MTGVSVVAKKPLQEADPTQSSDQKSSYLGTFSDADRLL
jgi:hypothetical protein